MQILRFLFILAVISIGVAVLAYIGYWIVGILIWAIPFLLSVGILAAVLYGIGYTVFKTAVKKR